MTASQVDFDRFFRATFPRLVATLRLSGAPADAEDIAQEALARTFTHFGTIDSPGPYAYRIAFRLIARSPSRRHAALRLRIAQQPAPVPTHDDSIALDLQRALARLPPQQRACAVLVICEGLTPAEVAAIVGVRASTVRSNLSKARKTLRRALDPDPGP